MIEERGIVREERLICVNCGRKVKDRWCHGCGRAFISCPDCKGTLTTDLPEPQGER